MRPLADFPVAARRRVTRVLADIDDTLTTEGQITAEALAAIERLAAAGIDVVPVTGRPAGWCDHIARMWPVAAVIGENGAFYFRHDRLRRTLARRFYLDAGVRAANRRRLETLGREILAQVPGSALASDQAYRDADLAVDYREDVAQLPRPSVDRIVALMIAAGARAKVSSIHVNGWFGDYDKLVMTRILFRELFAADLDAVKDTVVFVGDSPNDEPMFRFFSLAVGVANVRDFADQLKALPAFVTRARAGAGFAEVAAALLAAKEGRSGAVNRAPARRQPRKPRSGSRARAR
ncbi:MAG: HAD-IIB family hydrolase [Rhodospirillales bacterium]|nr:HAD-IIB family hydrolase [Rhodospirillales bacterium]MSP79672.1 HAD-IIB family hydrolase [Rhodospirillales bacterium]